MYGSTGEGVYMGETSEGVWRDEIDVESKASYALRREGIGGFRQSLAGFATDEELAFPWPSNMSHSATVYVRMEKVQLRRFH